MSGKDVLKLLLIAYGFAKIEIKTYRANYGYIGYEIHAMNEDGKCFDEENCDGIIFNITNIIERMKQEGVEPQYDPFNGVFSIKELLKL